MKIESKGVYAECSVGLQATDRGFIYPQLHELKVDFGESEVYNDHPFMQYWYR